MKGFLTSSLSMKGGVERHFSCSSNNAYATAEPESSRKSCNVTKNAKEARLAFKKVVQHTCSFQLLGFKRNIGSGLWFDGRLA